MIVPNLLPETIAGSLAKLAGGFSADTETRERMARYDAYEGRGLREVVAPYFTSKQLRSAPVMTQKVARKIIDARFCAYKTPPVRHAAEPYLDRLGRLDEDMVYLERMTGLQGTMAMLRFIDPKTGELESRVIPVFEPIVLQGEVEPSGIAYPLHDPTETDSRKRQWAVWTAVEHYHVVGGSVRAALFDTDEQPVTTHGIVGDDGEPLLPVLFSHSGPPVAQRWMRAGADDVVNAQLCFNVHGTHLNLCTLWQTHGQAVATGVSDPRAQIRIGVDEVVALPEGASFRFETPGGEPGKIIEAARWVVDSVAYANHLQVKWGTGGGATSGEHLRMMEVDLTEAVLSDFSRWRAFEAERFALDRALLRAAGITVPDEYSVDFSEPHIPDSPAEKREQWTWELDNGLTTKRRVLREMNPDMGEEQLDELLDEIGKAEPAPAVTGPSAFAAALARPVNA